jgi:mono/diheme cytochrome c family protein
MKKVLLLGTLVWVSAGVAVSFGWKAPDTQALIKPAQTLAQAQTPAPTPARAQAPAARPAAANLNAEYQQLVDRYCVTCHNQRLNLPAGAPLFLDQDKLDDLAADAATWEKVVRKLGVGAMPPPNVPTPGAEKLAEFRSWLQSSLDRAANVQRNPGRYTLHRLNRAEYQNAVRDMLGVDVDVTELLPSDGANFGFDNVASGLTMSPLLLERYLTAALRIASYAVGDTGIAAGGTFYPISLEVTQKEHVEGLPLGTRGGIKVRHIFPADAEYEFSGQLNRTILNGFSGIEGHEKPHDFLVLIDGTEVFRVAVGGPEDHKENAADPTLTGMQRMIERLRIRVPVTAGAHDVVFTWIEKPNQEQSVWLLPRRDTQEVHHAGGPPRLKTVTIEGPYNPTGISTTPSRERIMVCRPTGAADENACAQRIFSTLGRRAFRRPVTAEDLEGPMTFYRQAREQGGNFDAGIRAGVARVLASPSFLFRSESDPAAMRAGAAHPVTDLELASRLSFYMWSSIPDDQLLNLAIAGRLRAPGVLEAQVRRMIADPRADAMVENFTGQWLQLRNLEQRVNPDILLFPDFDDNIRKGFRRETEMLFAHVMRENRPATELLTADYTFVNERLARHYGIPNVYGVRFRQVPLTDINRRGLLGHGSILGLTSVANRTSPTIRGKYVMATLLNTPPLPPPPNVPELEASKEEGKATTVREQLERHRANAVCASCHRNIDPIGFALENFDSTGRWREQTPDGLKVDTVGTLVDGREVNGPAQLRQALMTTPEIFVSALTENMLVYALGRGLEPSDMAVVRSVVRNAARNNYQFHSIITGIVQSAPFQMRTKLAATSETRVAQSN